MRNRLFYPAKSFFNLAALDFIESPSESLVHQDSETNEAVNFSLRCSIEAVNIPPI
jgi:hypothetical protein